MQREPMGHNPPIKTIDDDREVAFVGSQVEQGDVGEP